MFFLAACSKNPIQLPKKTPLPTYSTSIDLKQVWSKKVASSADVSSPLAPTFYETLIYQPSHSGQIFVLDAKTGQTLETFHSKEKIATQLAVNHQHIAFVTPKGKAILLNRQGKVVWETELGSKVLATPALGSGFAVVQTVEGDLIGLNVVDGRKTWVSHQEIPTLSLQGTSSPLLIEELIIAGFSNGKLVISELETGRSLWERKLAIPKGQSELAQLGDIDANPVFFDKNIYAAAYQGNLVAISLATGQVVWTEPLSIYQDFMVTPEHIFVTDDQENLIALDRLTGHPIWQISDLKKRALTSPLLWKDKVVVGDGEGYLHFLSPQTGQYLSRIRASHHKIHFLAPSSDSSLLIVLDQKGYLRSFQKRDTH